MSQSKPLIPIQTPLQTTTLIEASAGTGKTFTMASLYLRLLLQLGEFAFSRALAVDEVLVVTFTEASTQELKARIRDRIVLAKKQFLAYRDNPDIGIFVGTDNEFLVKSKPEDKASDQYLRELDMELSIQRLQFAEQNMDLAAIYTIHGFCHRMLMQYAVDSGIHFHLDLVQDETPLLVQLTNEMWREKFYPQSLLVTQFIQQHLGSPQDLIEKIRPYLTGESLELTPEAKHLLEKPFDEFLTEEIEQSAEKMQRVLQAIKSEWQQHFSAFSALFQADFAKGNAMSLSKSKISETQFQVRCAKIEQWIQRKDLILPPDDLWKFKQSYVDGAIKKNSSPIGSHSFLIWLDEQHSAIEPLQQQMLLLKNVLVYHCIDAVNARLVEYKQNHQQKGFNDLLRLLNQALKSERGSELAALIRHQYPFAMIDEFQDTDETQYQIFSRLYVEQPECGFMMIGDPKQAIYQFRGADIFTYLKAANDAKEQRFTLSKNYRSTPELIEAVNGLLNFDRVFLFDQIRFETVKSGKNQPRFMLNGEQEPPLHFYVNEDQKTKSEDLAECCAESILHWLQSANNGQAFLGDKPLKSDDIAVLVRTGTQAAKVKEALRRRGIASVYLSDRSNVFKTKEARELVFILQACLDPLKERHILNAIATGVFGLTATEIQYVKQDEKLLEGWIRRFENYQRIWRWKGVLPMLYQLLLDKSQADSLSIPEKILTLPKGERRLTDLLHLAELLQQNASLHESEAALFHWFERQIQGSNDDQNESSNSRQVRLESEQKLVKIVTIHKSKGLEYGLVWLPFLGEALPKFSDAVKCYHDENNHKFWDIQEKYQEQVEAETLAEEMRLLYVALTRARYQLCLAVPTEFGSQWNALYYLLTQGKIGVSKKIAGKAKGAELVRQLVKNLGEAFVKVSSLEFDINAEKWTGDNSSNSLQWSEFSGNIEQNWGLASFSSLKSIHERRSERYVDNQQVYTSKIADSNTAIERNSALNETIWADFPEERTPFDFPRGVRFGRKLHQFLESYRFNQEISDDFLTQFCKPFQLDESWNAPLKQWLLHLFQEPILPNMSFCLENLPPQDYRQEVRFCLKLDRAFRVSDFNEALRQHHHLFTTSYLWEDMQGMLTGSIDLVFRQGEKYYLLDYKSNFLGDCAQDYSQEALKSAMQKNYYDLQYVIYTLALHFYLRDRIPDYSYETHFGGVIYAFVRGMGQGKGVFFERPTEALIEALEPLFYDPNSIKEI